MSCCRNDGKSQHVSKVVLDASAILAVLFRETGHEQVIPYLKTASVSAVNIAEVLSKAVERTIPLEAAQRYLLHFEFEEVPFTSEQAAIVASLRPITRKLGLSLGDRACLALGLQRNVPVVTAERSWKQVDVGVCVETIR